MTPFPAPILPVVGALAAALVTSLLGRWPRVQSLAGATTAVILAVWLFRIDLEQPASRIEGLFGGDTWLLAGQSFLVTQGTRELLVFLFVGLSLLFLFSLLARQGSSFVPAALAAFSPLAASLMAQNISVAAVLLVIGAVLLCMTYFPQIAENSSGTLRYLQVFVLALPLLLLASWFFESGQAAGSSLFPSAVLVTALALMLAGFPFYIWVYPITAEAPTFVPGLFFGLAQLAVITVILTFLAAYLVLQRSEQFELLLRLSGLGTIIVATVLVLVARQWRFLFGHLLLFNMGMALFTLTLSQEIAAEAAMLLHISRFISLLLAGVAMSLLPEDSWGDRFAGGRGQGWDFPFAAALLGYALLSLVGAPLTIGFFAQWTIIETLQEVNILLPITLGLAVAAAVYAVLRALFVLFDPHERGNERLQAIRPLWKRVLAGGLLILALCLALFPQGLFSAAARLSGAAGG